MNEQIAPAPNAGIKNLTYLEIDNGKVITTDQGDYGKVLGVSSQSRDALSKIGSMQLKNTQEINIAPEVGVAPTNSNNIQTDILAAVSPVPEPIPVPTNEMSIQSSDEADIKLENPVNISKNIGDLATSIDITQVPGEVVGDIKNAIVEPPHIDSPVVLAGNEFKTDIDQTIPETHNEVSNETLDSPIIEPITEVPQALEPATINEKLFEQGTPEQESIVEQSGRGTNNPGKSNSIITAQVKEEIMAEFTEKIEKAGKEMINAVNGLVERLFIVLDKQEVTKGLEDSKAIGDTLLEATNKINSAIEQSSLGVTDSMSNSIPILNQNPIDQSFNEPGQSVGM